MQMNKVKIVNRLGLHARAAAKFVEQASIYGSEVQLQRGNRKVNGKSIMGVMMLAAACGMEIEIFAEGNDEELAIRGLSELVANGFGGALGARGALMTLVLGGTPVSRGILIAPAVLLHRDRLDVREVRIAPELVGDEIARYKEALKETRKQLRSIRKQIPSQTPDEIASFIDAHLLMLADKALSLIPIKTISEQCCNAEWALQMQRDALVAVFDAMDDPYLKTRRDDVDYVVRKILQNLLNIDRESI